MKKMWQLCYMGKNGPVTDEFASFEAALKFKASLNPSKILGPVSPFWIKEDGSIITVGGDD